MSKAGLVRTILVVAAFAALEALCRTGIINRVTMIPPTEMVTSLWTILARGKFNADILFTLTNVIAAAALAIVAGFLIGAGLHALPRLRRPLEPLMSAWYAIPTSCSIRC